MLLQHCALKGKNRRTRLQGGRIRFLGECARRGRRPLQKQAGPREGGRHGGEGMPRGSFLFGREDFGVGGFGGGGGGDYVEGGVDIFGYGGEADFGAAGLVSQFHGNVLGAERGGGEND